MKCRHCKAVLEHQFLDLGFAPPSNAYLKKEQLNEPESYYPLRLFVCGRCWLVQTEDFTGAEALFTDEYAYFSSISKSWLQHAKRYCEDMTKRLGLQQDSFVVEVASNDGYLLRNFVENEIPCLGIEPTESTASAAIELGIPVRQSFFGSALAEELLEEGRTADLIIGNNVYAHVPDINDFTKGLKTLLKPEGTITLEFPHLMKLVEFNQFDTIYHEHFSYLSLTSVSQIFDEAGLRVYEVQELGTHGGSLRVYGCHKAASIRPHVSVEAMLGMERERGLTSLSYYQGFQARVDRIKNDFLSYLIDAKKEGKRVVAYGAAAKGNTLLNYAGVKADLIDAVYDAAPSKQGKFLPGSHIPILPTDQLPEAQPNSIVVLPWNIKEELIGQIQRFGLRCEAVTAIPRINVQ